MALFTIEYAAAHMTIDRSLSFLEIHTYLLQFYSIHHARVVAA